MVQFPVAPRCCSVEQASFSGQNIVADGRVHWKSHRDNTIHDGDLPRFHNGKCRKIQLRNLEKSEVYFRVGCHQLRSVVGWWRFAGIQQVGYNDSVVGR
jgi:hypothetical protein